MDLNIPMMRLVILPVILALLCLPQIAHACSCVEIDKAWVKSFIKNYDYVFVGSAVEVLHFDDDIRTLISERDKGYSEVLFKVDSMIKGDYNLKQIVINQFDQGSCLEWFKIGDQFVIVGNRVENVIWNGGKKEDFLSLEEVPPAPPGYNNSIQIRENRKAYHYWKRLARRHTIVTTDMCSTFRVGTEDANLFLK
ncbi:hypothetical protein [Roseivirga seohaensis]|uniref:hypothetical protein n=1 Tax=Roseivirga seohaensis TaxID=1914963 RepID=UPI003BA9F0DB